MRQYTPFISVVIPVFNRAWQLKRALESLASQTFKNFEVIVCDDGSTENIAAVVKDFGSVLKIQLMQMPNWGGPARPRNEGLRIAAGDWISFLDSDDWWDSDRLKIVSENLNETLDFLHHSLRVVRQSDIVNSRENRSILGGAIVGDPFKQMLLMGNPIATSSAVIRKSLLLSHDGMSEERDLIALEDFDCWLRLASAGARFYFLNQCLGNYWIGDDAISNFSEKQIVGQKCLYQRIESKIEPDLLEMALARQNYVLGSLHFRIGDLRLALQYLSLASPMNNLKLAAKRWVLIIYLRLKIAINTLIHNLSRNR